MFLPSGARPGDGVGYEAPSPAITRPSCYEIRFGDYPPTVGQPSGIPCPVTRPDGGPGSVPGWLAMLQAAQPRSRYSAPPDTYPLTAAGVREYLARNFILASEPAVVSTASGGGVLAAAFRYDSACFYVRMAPTSSASAVAAGAMWLAPADAQGSGCGGSSALAASALYGVDGAQEG
jgi:hypothetical protein